LGTSLTGASAAMLVRQAMSKRILGVGIILGGLIVLAIALIIGIGFPKFVYDTNLKSVCIQDASHPRYELWVRCSIHCMMGVSDFRATLLDVKPEQTPHNITNASYDRE